MIFWLSFTETTHTVKYSSMGFNKWIKVQVCIHCLRTTEDSPFTVKFPPTFPLSSSCPLSTNHCQILICLFFFLTEDIISLGGGRERRERNIHVRQKYWSVVFLYLPQPKIEPATQARALTKSQTWDILVYGTMLQITEPHWPGCDLFSISVIFPFPERLE